MALPAPPRRARARAPPPPLARACEGARARARALGGATHTANAADEKGLTPLMAALAAAAPAAASDAPPAAAPGAAAAPAAAGADDAAAAPLLALAEALLAAGADANAAANGFPIAHMVASARARARERALARSARGRADARATGGAARVCAHPPRGARARRPPAARARATPLCARCSPRARANARDAHGATPLDYAPAPPARRARAGGRAHGSSSRRATRSRRCADGARAALARASRRGASRARGARAARARAAAAAAAPTRGPDDERERAARSATTRSSFKKMNGAEWKKPNTPAPVWGGDRACGSAETRVSPGLPSGPHREAGAFASRRERPALRTAVATCWRATGARERVLPAGSAPAGERASGSGRGGRLSCVRGRECWRGRALAFQVVSSSHGLKNTMPRATPNKDEECAAPDWVHIQTAGSVITATVRHRTCTLSRSTLAAAMAKNSKICSKIKLSETREK